MDSGTSVPTRPTRIRLQQTGFRGKGLQAGKQREQRPGDTLSTLDSDTQRCSGSLLCGWAFGGFHVLAIVCSATRNNGLIRSH